jgi:hypothetical protein
MFKIGNTPLSDFRISFCTGTPEKCHSLSSYSLRSFQESELGEPSSLSLEFCCHLTALLPVHYFHRIGLGRWNPPRFPTRFFNRLLSVIPSDAAGAPSATEESRTRFCLHGRFSKDDLLEVFSHQFHPEVRLEFDYCRFDESVSTAVFSDLLQHSRHLRSVQIPKELIETDEEDKIEFPCYIDVIFKSADKFITYSGKLSRKLFSIAKNQNITEVSIYSPPYWSRSHVKLDVLDSYFQPFLIENSSLEQVLFRFHSTSNDMAVMFEQLHAWRAPAWRQVCFFNVYTSVGYNQEIQPWRLFHSGKCWDEDLFPSVVLKNFRCRMMGPLEGAMIGLAVKAINEGIAYRKATNHAPYDMSIANAGVLFSIMQNAARNSQIRFTAPGEFH